MPNDEFPDTISHYGVKGMKWGVRRDQRTLDRLAGRKTRSRKETAARNRRQDLSNRRRTISDKELESTIKRLSNEKKLKELVAQDLNPGRTEVLRILKQAGVKVGGAAAAGGLMYLIRGILTKEWGLDVLNREIKIKK